MKRVLIIATVLLAFGAVAAQPTTDPAAEATAVLQQNARAFETGDMKTLDALWAHDGDVTVFESGHANYGWADYRDHHLKPEVEEMKSVKYQLTDIKTRVAGTTAWSTFEYSISADYKGQRIDSAGLGTAVLENRDGSWRIVHWHTSAPRKQAGKKE
jgi:ketosteroid isomerase-like protein